LELGKNELQDKLSVGLGMILTPGGFLENQSMKCSDI